MTGYVIDVKYRIEPCSSWPGRPRYKVTRVRHGWLATTFSERYATYAEAKDRVRREEGLDRDDADRSRAPRERYLPEDF